MRDKRTTPANDHVAAVELKGQLEAKQYVEGEMHRVISPVADLRCDLGKQGLDRQLLRGDRFRVLEIVRDYAFGQADRGGYVGYVSLGVLDAWEEPTHWVHTRASFAFTEPNFKTPNPVFLSHGVRENIVGKSGRFSETSKGYFIPSAHLTTIETSAADPVTEAEKLLGTPYLWGGNSAAGIDCSGLVQGALMACGVDCPGDSDLQEKHLGDHLPESAGLQRNDLLFWKGHVAWVVDSGRILHANAFHMAVSYEPLEDAIKRIEAQGDGPVTARKRLGGLQK